MGPAAAAALALALAAAAAAALLPLALPWLCPTDPARQIYEERDPYFGVSLAFDTEALLEDVQTLYQHIQVRQTRAFGKILLIDDDLMLTERDEGSYHEMLAHVPLNYLPTASDVLIVGGGDGGACREVLRHPNVQRVVLVDIDEKVVEISRRHFPYLADGCYDDPRVTLLHEDAALWAEQALTGADRQRFDVVLVDSTDFGAADSLHTAEFYDMLRALARDGDGIVVINLTSLSWNLAGARRTVTLQAEIFEHVAVYQVFQPTYMSGHYAYTFMSGAVDPLSSRIDWAVRNLVAVAGTAQLSDRNLPIYQARLGTDIAETN
jgi:spermidine synthase